MPERPFDHRLLLKKLKKGPIDLDPAVTERKQILLTMDVEVDPVRTSQNDFSEWGQKSKQHFFSTL